MRNGFNEYIIKNDYAIIFIIFKKQTYECLVDLDILDTLKNINKKVGISCSSKRENKYYANIKYWDNFEQSSWTVYIHRLVLKLESASSRIKVDHKNHNTLDNRRENLRATTNSINMLNRINKQTNNTSGALRVDFVKRLNKFRARITINGEEKHLGLFPNIVDAENAVKNKRLEALNNAT